MAPKNQSEEKLLKIVANLDASIDQLQPEIDRLRKQLRRANTLRNKALAKLNEKHFNDMEWLINNPTEPGSEEALKAKIERQYGGTYRGPQPAGYMHTAKYVPIQALFEFQLNHYDDEQLGQDVLTNVRDFVEKYLQHFQALFDVDVIDPNGKRWKRIKLVGFKFRSQSSGLDYLGYDPHRCVWHHFFMRYGSARSEQTFDNFEQALTHAHLLAQKDDDYDDDE